MESFNIEEEITGLAAEIRNANPPEDLLPATLDMIKSGRFRCGHIPMNQATGLFAKGWSPRQSRLPIFTSLFLLFLFIPFFSFNPEPALNIIRLALLLLSLAMGTFLFFKPEKVADVDRKIMGSRLSHIGPAATRSQEILLFRVQAIYFILIAIFICRL